MPRARAAGAARSDTARALVEIAARRGFFIALDLLGNPTEAEDAVQEALVKACAKLDSLRDPAAAEAWFRRLLTNHCLSQLRRRKVRRALLGRWSRAAADEPPPLRWLDDDVARRDDARRALRALERLPVKQRAALILRYGHDMPVADVAAALGVSTTSAKTHLARGLRRLRAAMKEETR